MAYENHKRVRPLYEALLDVHEPFISEMNEAHREDGFTLVSNSTEDLAEFVAETRGSL